MLFHEQNRCQLAGFSHEPFAATFIGRPNRPTFPRRSPGGTQTVEDRPDSPTTPLAYARDDVANVQIVSREFPPAKKWQASCLQT